MTHEYEQLFLITAYTLGNLNRVRLTGEEDCYRQHASTQKGGGIFMTLYHSDAAPVTEP